MLTRMTRRKNARSGNPAVRAGTVPAVDPLERVRLAEVAYLQARSDLASAVSDSRAAGHTWEAIAATLGVTRQAVWRRFS
jgi:predicted transcriptional regulator